MATIPLFPLKTVLLPGTQLSLKIFEPRYLDMIAACLREDGVFGVVLIQHGEETSKDAEICSVGTTARIGDWEHRADGLLGITAVGVDRFQVLSTQTRPDGLLIGEVEYLEEIPALEIPEQYHYMLDLLDHIGAQAGGDFAAERSFSDILYQLIYLLPLQITLKQRLLEIAECSDRAAILHAELIRIGVIQYVKPEAAHE